MFSLFLLLLLILYFYNCWYQRHFLCIAYVLLIVKGKQSFGMFVYSLTVFAKVHKNIIILFLVHHYILCMYVLAVMLFNIVKGKIILKIKFLKCMSTRVSVERCWCYSFFTCCYCWYCLYHTIHSSQMLLVLVILNVLAVKIRKVKCCRVEKKSIIWTEHLQPIVFQCDVRMLL